MPQPGGGRGLLWPFVIAAPVVTVLLATGLIADSSQSGSSARIDRLRSWLDAAESHSPGLVDAPLEIASRWSRSDLLELRVDLSVLFQLVRNPSLRRLRFLPSDELRRGLGAASPRPPVLVFDGPLLELMRPLADRVRAAGQGATAKRGVLVHTDVLTLGLDRTEIAAAPRGDTRDRRRVFLDDGHLTALSHSPAHWELARFLAQSARDTQNGRVWVADWYRATVAFLQREQQYGSEHVREALRIVPADARLHLLAGGEHEALASPSVQSFVEATTRSASMTLSVQSADRELAEAQRFFSQAVDLDPGLAEARVRLGRVMALRGRSADAIAHLRQATLAEAEPLISFYAFLFLGSALETRRDYSESRDAYARAAALFPDAQSANLALAQLAWRFGDRRETTKRLEAALDSADGRSDPWRTYHLAQGRDAERMLRQVRESVTP